MRRIPPLALCALLAGCTSVDFVLLGQAVRAPAIDVEAVRVYLAEADVGAPYEKVALLFAESSTELGSEVKVVEALRREAARIGADGIVLLSLGEGMPNRLLDLGAEQRGRALAIRRADVGR